MIADPLQILGHHDEIQPQLAGVGVCGDQPDQLLFHLVEQVVHLVVFPADLPGQLQIPLYKGVHTVCHHPDDGLGHLLDPLAAGAVRQTHEPGQLRDVRRLVPDPFQIGNHLQRRGDLPQVPCHGLLLQQQPVARDLREISSALKMISDLERIGDQAADIAELTRFVRLPDGPGRQRIEEMSKAVIRMVTDSVDSFVKRDLELAREVCREDDQVDDLFNQVKKELIGLIAADADSGELWLDLIMVAKYLERIGDHATNVAEWVEYSITGNHPSNN